jgi:hypothetical protein
LTILSVNEVAERYPSMTPKIDSIGQKIGSGQSKDSDELQKIGFWSLPADFIIGFSHFELNQLKCGAGEAKRDKTVHHLDASRAVLLSKGYDCIREPTASKANPAVCPGYMRIGVTEDDVSSASH